MANNDGSSSMQSDQYFAEMLSMMREQGRKDNPVTIQLGVMQSEKSVKIDDLVLNAEDLYIADYLVAGYTRKIKIPYISEIILNVQSGMYDVSSVEAETVEQTSIEFADGLKKGDLVVVQRLYNTNKYVIMAKVVGLT